MCIVTGAVDFRALMYHRNVPPPDGYVAKPIKSDVLMMTVRKLLETRPTAEGQCICQTDEGYFYSLGGEVGTFACDATVDLA